MGALTWVVIGLIAGWAAARLIYSARGLLRVLTVGLVGAVLGAFLFTHLGVDAAPNFSGQIVTAVVGAIALLWIWRVIRRT